MNETLKVVLSLSLSGTLLILLLFLLWPLFKERLSKRWQYYIWLVAVARLLLPFALETNLMTTFFQGIERAAQQAETAASHTQQDGIVGSSLADETAEGQKNRHNGQADSMGQTEQMEQAGSVRQKEPTEFFSSFVSNTAALWEYLWLVWLAGALILVIRKITIYQDFVKYIRAGCAEVTDIDLLERFGKLVEQKRIKTAVELYTNHLISSPLLIGFFRPCIVLPADDLPPADFDYTILHELMHFKRRDMFYKWLVQFTVCVHWFNPFVYRMGREIGRACELSCDEAVIREFDRQGRQAYGDTLLNAIGNGGSYKNSLVSLTLNESRELLKERLDAIMNFEKKTKWGIAAVLLSTVTLACAAAFLGVYAGGLYNRMNPDAGMDTVSLYSNTAEIIGFQQGEQAADKETAVNITEDNAKIQLNAAADGDSYRTLEVIDPDGEVVRTYTFNQDGFISGNQEYLYGFMKNDMIMVTDIVYPGTWHVRLRTDRTPAEKTTVTAKLVDPFVWGFASEADIFSADTGDGEADVFSADTGNDDAGVSSAEKGNDQTGNEQAENDQMAEDPLLSAQIYDHYRTYAQTKEDIQNGYIVNTGVSFSERAMPTVTEGGRTSFYVNHDNSVELSIMLKNLIDGTGRGWWTPDSFVSFEVYDPSGRTAYSFYKEGKDIQDAVDINTELAVYPGEWQYKISFAYTTNGTDPSDMRFALRYKTIFEDDMQWLFDNKLNKIR